MAHTIKMSWREKQFTREVLKKVVENMKEHHQKTQFANLTLAGIHKRRIQESDITLAKNALRKVSRHLA